MAQGLRPGGLTALAVVNFVLAGLGVLSAFSFLFLMAMGDEIIEAQEEAADEAAAEPGADEEGAAAEPKPEKDPSQEANEAQIRRLQDNPGKAKIQVGLIFLEAVLLLISGLGYLGQKRVQGRILGSICAIVGLGSVLFQLTYLPLGLEHMSSFIYPVMTLVLLNTTFRHDFVN